MNKTEFIASIAEKNGITKKSAGESVNLVLGAIVDALKSGEEVAVVGFGKFYIVDVPTREARNPSTGETMTIDAHKTPKFKFAANIKESVR